jgi:FMN phosphatase YigB (HAD superfamily)
VAIRAVLFDLDSTLWHVEGPFDWEWLTALQSAEIEPEFARLEFRHRDAADFVRRFWANFRDDDSLPNARLEELRGSAVVRKTLAQFGADCQDYDGECVWDALNNVPFQCFNIRPFSDAFSTLETLSSSGLRLAIVNNRPLKATTSVESSAPRAFPTCLRRS